MQSSWTFPVKSFMDMVEHASKCNTVITLSLLL